MQTLRYFLVSAALFTTGIEGLRKSSAQAQGDKPSAWQGPRPQYEGVECSEYVEKKTVNTSDGVRLQATFRMTPAPPEGQHPLFVYGHGLFGAHIHLCEGHWGPAHAWDFPRTVGMVSEVARPSLVLYNARGHPDAVGWMGRPIQQFHWSVLAQDMMRIAESYRASAEAPLILGGESMGAATALWAAKTNPNAVSGLVLNIPPTMWETRRAQAGEWEKKADEMREESPDYADVFLGASLSDMPPEHELALLGRMQLPVLIITQRGDSVHPVSSATKLAEVLGPRVTLKIFDGVPELQAGIGETLVEWLNTLPSVPPPSR